MNDILTEQLQILAEATEALGDLISLDQQALSANTLHTLETSNLQKEQLNLAIAKAIHALGSHPALPAGPDPLFTKLETLAREKPVNSPCSAMLERFRKAVEAVYPQLLVNTAAMHCTANHFQELLLRISGGHDAMDMLVYERSGKLHAARG